MRTENFVIMLMLVSVISNCEKFAKNENKNVLKINYNSKNITKLLDRILKGNDRRIRPNYSGEPVVVGITSFYLTK